MRPGIGLIVPIVLAAGDSSRMGSPKALLGFGDGTFLSRILDTVGGVLLADPVVVLGKHANVIAPQLAGRSVRVVLNRQPERGQLSSLQLALKVLPPCQGCLVWPVDQPAVSAEVVRGLVRVFGEAEPLIVMPRCAGRRGHPAIFSSCLFAELLTIPAEHGPKELVRVYEEEIAILDTDERGTIEDIDTPEDYERFLARA